MKETIIWTVLPNGVRNGVLKLSVFIAPRLEPMGSAPDLDSFPHFHDWPATLAGISFEAVFEPTQGPTKQLFADRDGMSVKADSGFWKQLFPLSTPVQDHSFVDLSARKIHSYPALNVLEFIEQQYRKFAAGSPTEHPPVDVLANPQTGFGRLDFRAAGLLELPRRNYDRESKGDKTRAHTLLTEDIKQATLWRVNTLFQGNKFVPKSPPNPANDFAQVKLFHAPRTTKKSQLKPPDFDFHRMIAALGQHPHLLRLAGLVVDLEVRLDTLGFSNPVDGKVWIKPGWSPGATDDTPMKTEFRFDPYAREPLAFIARARQGSDIVSRFLKVEDQRYAVVQIDIDGAAEKAMQFAENLSRLSGSAKSIHPHKRTLKSTDTPEQTGLPSLQSAGLALVRPGRAGAMHQRLLHALQANQSAQSSPPSQPAAAPLWADDLTRGYRVDIEDGNSGRWRSLCSRLVSYDRLDGSPKLTVSDEGWITSGATETTDPNAPDAGDLYLQESVFRWGGWSLVTPRPGRHLDKDQQAATTTHQPPPEMSLSIETKAAKGTLPKLRYGTDYRVRARAVDLAGNSVSLEEANELMETQLAERVVTPTASYFRYDRIAQPVLMLRKAVNNSPGEELERMVIRSFNSGDPQPGEKVAAGELTSGDSQRHLAPTGTGQLGAETHGEFDVAGGLDKAAWQTIVNNDAEFDLEAAHPEPLVDLPYLPDPPGRGAAFLNLPRATPPDNTVTVFTGGGKNSWSISPPPKPKLAVTQVEFGSAAAWPKFKAFRLRVVASQVPKDPDWKPVHRVLTVYLPPAEIATVRFSSYIDKEHLDKMGVWHWIDEEGKGNFLADRVLAGIHWMLTPYRELAFVHAVQRPLIKPEFQALESHRLLGDTFADLEDQIPISGRSTIKLDIKGSWFDPIDTGEKPEVSRGGGYAFEAPLKYTDTDARFGPGLRLAFNPQTANVATGLTVEAQQSTTDRISRITPTLQTGFEAAKPGRLTTKPGAVEAVNPGPPDLKVAGGSSKPTPSFTIGRHEFGDTRHRRITYNAIATSRFREYMPFEPDESDPAKTITRSSEPVTIDILNSARPAAPDVVYILPTFGWEEQEGLAGVTRRRLGGGLRVYLRRPWYSSGDGELLGAVVKHQSRRRLSNIRGVPDLPNALRPYVSQWGMDPLWLSSPTSSALVPRVSDFKNAVTSETGLTLDEVSGARVDVAGFTVGSWDDQGMFTGYDSERELWYCDIEMDYGSTYFPFVRLALARYQPKSIKWKEGDVKLSRVVLADYAQLTPDRAASITFQSETELQVTVSGLTAKRSSAQKYGQVGSIITPTPLSVSRTVRSESTEQALRAQTATAGVEARKQLAIDSLRRFDKASETGGNTVEVSLETLPPEGTDLGWLAVPGTTADLPAGPAMGALTVWSGQVTLPEPRGTKRFRLVIREYEWYIVEGEPVVVGDQLRKPVSQRLVYADTLEL